MVHFFHEHASGSRVTTAVLARAAMGGVAGFGQVSLAGFLSLKIYDIKSSLVYVCAVWVLRPIRAAIELAVFDCFVAERPGS